MEWRTCDECEKVYRPGKQDQRFCSYHCARIAQARHGIPSLEDKEARFAEGVLKLHREIFK